MYQDSYARIGNLIVSEETAIDLSLLEISERKIQDEKHCYHTAIAASVASILGSIALLVVGILCITTFELSGEIKSLLASLCFSVLVFACAPVSNCLILGLGDWKEEYLKSIRIDPFVSLGEPAKNLRHIELAGLGEKEESNWSNFMKRNPLYDPRILNEIGQFIQPLPR